jgi:thiol-disulfide isomerase/thioredoxin
MKPSFFYPRFCAISAGAIVLMFWLMTVAMTARADDATPATASSAAATNTDEAATAWRALRKTVQPPMTPEAWQTNAPTQEEQSKFFLPFVLKGADAAKDFYTHFPNDTHAKDAHMLELQLLTVGVQRFGDTSQADRLAALQNARLNDPNASEDEKMQMRIIPIQKLFAGLPGTADETLKSARALLKDFPKRTEGYQVMIELLQNLGDDQQKQTAIAKEIVDSAAPDEIKEQARGVLKQMDALGKPLDIQFTAFDGRTVDLGKMQGKVVLIDFWATWCGPCMGEVPNVKAAYQKLHDKGFEIVGISFDEDKDALTKTLKEKEMTWPQYFDGSGWKNKYGEMYGIHGIPTMWLVDKKGNLRDMNARGALEEKVTKLLAE